ncbi:unnamed protein product [Ectocarpus fasciculatus]
MLVTKNPRKRLLASVTSCCALSLNCGKGMGGCKPLKRTILTGQGRWVDSRCFLKT